MKVKTQHYLQLYVQVESENLQQDASSNQDSQATQHEIRAVFHSEAKVVTQNWIHQSIQYHIVGIQYVIAHCQKQE